MKVRPSEPIAVRLQDGRTLNIHEYEYIRGTMGSRMVQPDPPEVTVHEAWWDDGDGEVSAHESELDDLMNGPEYDLIIEAFERRADDQLAAAMTCADDDWEPEP